MGIGSFFQQIRDRFFSSPKKVTSVVVTVFVLLAIPITYTLVSQQQDIRQRASGNNTWAVTARLVCEDGASLDTIPMNLRLSVSDSADPRQCEAGIVSSDYTPGEKTVTLTYDPANVSNSAGCETPFNLGVAHLWISQAGTTRELQSIGPFTNQLTRWHGTGPVVWTLNGGPQGQFTLNYAAPAELCGNHGGAQPIGEAPPLIIPDNPSPGVSPVNPSPISSENCSAPTDKPNNCSCNDNTVCASNYCVGTGTIPSTCQPVGTQPIAPQIPNSFNGTCSSSGLSLNWQEGSSTSSFNVAVTDTSTSLTTNHTVPGGAAGNFAVSYSVPIGKTYSVKINATNYFGTSAYTNNTSINCGNTTLPITAVPNPSPSFSPNPSPSVSIQPSPNPSPSTSPAAGNTSIAFSFSLPGIGTNSAKGENNTPKHASTTIQFALVNPNLGSPFESFSTATYNPTTGFYEVSDSKTINNPGTYALKVRTIQSLWKQYGGFLNIAPNGSATSPATELTSGDLNQDNITDLIDYNIMIGCMNKPFDDASCKTQDYTGTVYNKADLNDDGVVDLKDLNTLLRSYKIHEGD